MKKIITFLSIFTASVTFANGIDCSKPIQAENFDALSAQNVVKVQPIPRTKNPVQKFLVGCKNNFWFQIKNVDFSKGGFNTFRVRASSNKMMTPQFIEVREGSADGKLVAKARIQCTNSITDYITTTVEVEYSPKGVVDLYFVAKGDDKYTFNVDWVHFSKDKIIKHEKSLADFFMPMQPQGKIEVVKQWGDNNVQPRDVKNGLEGIIGDKLKWCYWDGGIVKSDDGKYHLYASRWGQEFSHSKGWHEDSKAIHAVSDNIMGPYTDMGLIWPKDDGGKAHNVFGFRMNDGRYGVVTSEITDGIVYASKSADGPFKKLGKIEIDTNGFPMGLARYGKAPYHMSNVQIRPRPSGKGYMLICRSTAVLISENDVLGPYKIMSDRVYSKFPDLAKGYNEDPTMWYSGGFYHIVYNHWPSQISHHFVSKDGIKDWKYMGVAFDKVKTKIFKYTDGTINDWVFIERPTAVVGKDGHVTHFIFSVIDVHKGRDGANDNHASKIIVVPFNGKAFDKYIAKQM